jgi:uncharacterized membrane protein
MTTARIEAFSDGVIAIIVTIMVLELRTPSAPTLPALLKLTPVLLGYLISFVVAAIMWVNHHHLMHHARHASAALLWSNNALLFCMSLIPFATAWLGQNPGAPLPVALYGGVLASAAYAFTLLRWVVNHQHECDGELREYNDRMLRKSFYSSTLYASTIALAFVHIYVAYAIFILIPVIYFLPERKLAEHSARPH